jgi:small subunit ribosomal protein S21
MSLCRFKRQVAKAGIYADIKKHQFFETPQEEKA